MFFSLCSFSVCMSVYVGIFSVCSSVCVFSYECGGKAAETGRDIYETSGEWSARKQFE